jgi:hypothetical protein
LILLFVFFLPSLTPAGKYSVFSAEVLTSSQWVVAGGGQWQQVGSCCHLQQNGDGNPLVLSEYRGMEKPSMG